MKDCIFCKIISGEIPSLKLYEDENTFAFMDINPKVDGHTLIIPKKHITDFTELTSNDLNNIYSVAKKLTPMLMKKLNAKAFTMGCNYGDSQAVKHFHLHLLPDFMCKEATRDPKEVFESITEKNIH